ncbi:MAG: hypothetical protein WCS37_12840 [Chloroflexota bacterium]
MDLPLYFRQTLKLRLSRYPIVARPFLKKMAGLFVPKFKKWGVKLLKYSPIPLFPEPPVALTSTEDRVLIVTGAACVCPRCGGGPLLFEAAALKLDSNVCPICTRIIQAKDYRPTLLECKYVVLEDLCEKCGLPVYAESQVDWVKVSHTCLCQQSTVKINSPRLHKQIQAAMTNLKINLPENMPSRGTKKVICPFSREWHKESAMFYFKTGRIVCWNCRKMTSLLNLIEPGSEEVLAVAEELRKVSSLFWEQGKAKKGNQGKPAKATAVEPSRPTHRELIDQWFSKNGHIPLRLATRYQQWLQTENRISLSVRPIPNWPPQVYSATVQRATHLERPGTTVHFIKGAVVCEDYTLYKQLIAPQESFWEDDSRHLVAELKIMDGVSARWESQVYSFIEHNNHLLDQWTRAHGRIFCAYVETEAVPGITAWAWGTGTKTPDFVILSVSNNNKLLVSICDIKLSAQAWSAEHDLQLSPENFRTLLHNYPLLINHLLEAAYYSAPQLNQTGFKVEWPANETEFLQWLDQDRIQIQVGFRVIPDLPSRRRALLVTREKTLYTNGSGRQEEGHNIPDRPYLLVPCCLNSLYCDESSNFMTEELVNFDGIARLRSQVGTWERLWLYEKYSRRVLALVNLLRRRGWDISNPAHLRHSLYECSTQLGVTTSSQYLSQLASHSYQRISPNRD